VATPFAARGAFGAIASPLGNVHATGMGVRLHGGKAVAGDFVLKVFVFDKQNNHVLADTNQLPLGTPIVQPFGPGPQDVFAKLTAFEPIRFPSISTPTPRNRIDAAIAAVSDTSLVSAGRMFGIPRYKTAAGRCT
jgi:hypothetical protein